MTEQIFKALGDATRLRILSLLLERELCVCKIEYALNLTQSNASRHLTVLKNAGVLESRKQAQWAYYKISETFREENPELNVHLKIHLPNLPTFAEDAGRLKSSTSAETCSCKLKISDDPNT